MNYALTMSRGVHPADDAALLPAALLSVVVPVHNESGNVGPLAAEIAVALAGIDHEIVFVDDASTDGTAAEIAQTSARCLRHARRGGQSAAIHSGVRAARGTWIATLDGDGQNDPQDIRRLFDHARAVGEAPDGRPVLVAGWRRRRQDRWLKRVSSRIANAVRGRLLRDDTPDSGCGLKVFRRDAFLDLPRFDHMHRFLPALFVGCGGRVVSLPVNHRSRLHGRSNYGTFDRLAVGIVDLAGVWWLLRRQARPPVTEEAEVSVAVRDRADRAWAA